jgi:lipid A 3-O-deacylase
MGTATIKRFRQSTAQGKSPGCNFNHKRTDFRLPVWLKAANSRFLPRRWPLTQMATWMLAVLLIGPLAATAATAADSGPPPDSGGYFHRMFFGVLAHDVDGLWSGTRKEDGVDINGEIVFCRTGISVLAGTLRPNLGLSFNSQGDTSKFYGGVLWEINTKHGLFFASGLGAAVHNGELDTDDKDKKSLGSRVLFRIPFEVGYQITARHSLSLLFDHVSNAGLASSNEGLDTIGIRYGYSF